MNSIFRVGQRVRALSDYQGLERGARYLVLAVHADQSVSVRSERDAEQLLIRSAWLVLTPVITDSTIRIKLLPDVKRRPRGAVQNEGPRPGPRGKPDYLLNGRIESGSATTSVAHNSPGGAPESIGVRVRGPFFFASSAARRASQPRA